MRRTRCCPSFCPLMPAGPRKPVKRHNGRFYCLTRDVFRTFCGLFHPPGRILGKLSGGRGFPHFTYTHLLSSCECSDSRSRTKESCRELGSEMYTDWAASCNTLCATFCSNCYTVCCATAVQFVVQLGSYASASGAVAHYSTANSSN